MSTPASALHICHFVNQPHANISCIHPLVNCLRSAAHRHIGSLHPYCTSQQFLNLSPNKVDDPAGARMLGAVAQITKWAARTHNCDKSPSSVVCMACAMNMPAFTASAKVAPIGATLLLHYCRISHEVRRGLWKWAGVGCRGQDSNG